MSMSLYASSAYYWREHAMKLEQERDELREELARLREQEPAAWKHDCAGLCTNDVELWIDACPHCGKPRAAPPAPAQPADIKPVTRNFRTTEFDTPAAQPAQRLPLVQATAPREIWLQVSDDAEDKAEPFPENHDGITWCQDSVLSCEVRYVRADLAAAKDTP